MNGSLIAMSLAVRRRPASRAIVLDRALEAFPLFRLSDTADEGMISFALDSGARWRVLAAPGDRLPGTFDQDVYIELLHRFHEAGSPSDGAVTFTLHNFLRSMGRRVDGRTYEQLRASLSRLERTVVESNGAYFDAAAGAPLEGAFTLLKSVIIERRRSNDRDQLTLFSSFTASEPGDARVLLSPYIRGNIGASHVVTLSAPRYLALSSPVARRLYRLLEVARENGALTWRIELTRLAEQLPLTQRYPSHLQRVLQPAHEMLVAAGLLRDAVVRQNKRQWYVDYMLGSRLL